MAHPTITHMRPAEIFRFCPRCAAPRPDTNVGHTPLRCSACDFTFYFNPTVAGAAFIFRPDGNVLLIRRAKDPAAGKFGVPGGFLDFGESAEEGTRREVREEVGLELQNLRFVTSAPNLYLYREVLYPVVDLYFAANAINPDNASALDGVRSVEWRALNDIPNDEIAFESMRAALRSLRSATPDLC